MRSIRDVEVAGKRVLVRVDFNVPLDPVTKEIRDDTRIKASLPTINYLIEKKARVILASHLGRPEGRVVKELSLYPVARRLSLLLGKEVKMASDAVGKEVEEEVAGLKEGEVLLLENLRFHPGEEENDPSFAQALASLADIFVNDAFSVSHRAHASVEKIASYLPAYSGFLLEKELEALDKVLSRPARPFGVIIGGAKVKDKMAVLSCLLEKADGIFIGGGLAATFLKAKGYSVGLSPVEEDKIEFCRQIMERAKEKGIDFLLPEDVIVAKRAKQGERSYRVKVENIPRDMLIVDVGSETTSLFASKLQNYRTIFWNGPLGIIEIADFNTGSREIARFLSRHDAISIVGGGSTVELIQEMGLIDEITYVSLGGGATLEFIEGKTLPGIAALSEKEG